MFNSKRGYAFGLILVLSLGALLRLYHLSTVPTELCADEIALYDSVASIVKTGHDLDGTLQPFLYQSFTRNPPVYAVAGYMSTVLLGKSVFAWRLPAAIFGLFAILLIYWIAFEVTGRRYAAFLAALLLAIQPLFIQFSRIGWEPASELPFLLGGLLLLLHAFKNPKGDGTLSPVQLLVATILLATTAYTYMAGLFYATTLAGGLIILNCRVLREGRNAWSVVACAALYFLFVAPACYMLFLEPTTSSRIHDLSTFGHGLSLASMRTFLWNYGAHFNWSYMVATGDPVPGITWRYLNGFGAFYWWTAPLAMLGIVGLFSFVRPSWLSTWCGMWLLIYPLGGALTNEGAGGVPNAPRTLAGAPIECILAAVGSVVIVDFLQRTRWPRKRVLASFCLLVTALSAQSCWSFATFYFTDYVHQNSKFVGVRNDRTLRFSARALDELPRGVLCRAPGVVRARGVRAVLSYPWSDELAQRYGRRAMPRQTCRSRSRHRPYSTEPSIS